MATKSEIKKWLKEELKGFVKQFGFTIGNYDVTGTLAIYHEDELSRKFLALIVDSDSVAHIAAIRINPIEELLLKITKNEEYLQNNTIIFHSLIKRYNYFSSTNIEEFTGHIEVIKQQFPLMVEKFNYYTEPMHVLELWDSLNSPKERSAYFQTPYKYCNILVTSKISNDPLFKKRAEKSLEIYKKYIAEGENFTKELEACEKIVKYFEGNEI